MSPPTDRPGEDFYDDLEDDFVCAVPERRRMPYTRQVPQMPDKMPRHASTRPESPDSDAGIRVYASDKEGPSATHERVRSDIHASGEERDLHDAHGYPHHSDQRPPSPTRERNRDEESDLRPQRRTPARVSRQMTKYLDLAFPSVTGGILKRRTDEDAETVAQNIFVELVQLDGAERRAVREEILRRIKNM